MDLTATSALLRLLSDPTRVRLLALLDQEELTVAELSDVLRLAQPRVSTHLAKLKELDLVRDRRSGVSAYYRGNTELDAKPASLIEALRASVDDALIANDLKRLPGVLVKRARGAGWADSVAGDMERHYSPGRTWEALARALTGLVQVGDVLDIASGDGVLAELLAPHARSILCLDSGERVVAAARKRLRHHANVEIRLGDMHALQLGKRRFDVVLLLHALTYSDKPNRVVREAADALRPGGRLVALTLGRHQHEKAVTPFDHRNLGFRVSDLRRFARAAGLQVLTCECITRERRSPHFEVLSLLARKPA